MERKIFICDCNSLEHQYTFWYDEEENEVYFEPHLYSGGKWFQRFLYRLNYLFGYKSRFGAFDEVIINPKDSENIIKYLEKIINKEVDNIADRGRD